MKGWVIFLLTLFVLGSTLMFLNGVGDSTGVSVVTLVASFWAMEEFG